MTAPRSLYFSRVCIAQHSAHSTLQTKPAFTATTSQHRFMRHPIQFPYRSMIAALLATLALGACGGGGSGGGESGGGGTAAVPPNTATPAIAQELAPPADGSVGTPKPPATVAPVTAPDPTVPVATESTPAASTVALSLQDLMPMAYGDSWFYRITDASGAMLGNGDRLVLSAEDARIAVRDIEPGSAGDDIFFVRRSDGLYLDFSRDASLPAQAAAQIGLVRAYAQPTYAIGEKRTVVRQGAWGEDVNADGQTEQFRLEYTQVFQGFETISLPWGTVSAARFSNAYQFTLLISSTGERRGVITTEEAYLAPGLGPVRMVRRITDLNGTLVQPARTWQVQSLTVGGKSYP